MRKFLIGAAILIGAVGILFSLQGVVMPKNELLIPNADCTAMEASRYVMGNDKNKKIVTLNDPDKIAQFISLMNRIPLPTKKFAKFSEGTEIYSVTLTCGEKTQTLEFYEGHFRNPDGGAINPAPGADEEAALNFVAALF